MQNERKTSTLKSIRERCLECVEGQAEVRNCTHFNCPLWPFRMGKNPFRPPVSEARRALLRKNAGLSAEGGGPRAKAGVGVEIETLRSWADRALPMGSVPVPDPRDMNPEELAALGCPNRPPSRALKTHDWERDSNHAERLAGKRVGPASKTPIHRQPNEQVVHEGHLGTPIGRSAKNGGSLWVDSGA